jgi:hypothetical protein
MELLDLSKLEDDLLPDDINTKSSDEQRFLVNSPISSTGLFPGLSGHPLIAADLSASSDSLLLMPHNDGPNDEGILTDTVLSF